MDGFWNVRPPQTAQASPYQAYAPHFQRQYQEFAAQPIPQQQQGYVAAQQPPQGYVAAQQPPQQQGFYQGNAQHQLSQPGAVQPHQVKQPSQQQQNQDPYYSPPRGGQPPKQPQDANSLGRPDFNNLTPRQSTISRPASAIQKPAQWIQNPES